MSDEPNKGGRPSDYTEELAARICAEIGQGSKLKDICEAEDMPCDRTVYRWLAANDQFSQQYARAMESRANVMAEEILEIADNATNDWMQRNHGEDDPGWALNGDHVQRSKLRIDSRKWLMSKMAPKKYGDKVTQELTGPEGKAIQVNISSDDDSL